MNKLIKISSNENDEQEITVKSSLIEANELKQLSRIMESKMKTESKSLAKNLLT